MEQWQAPLGAWQQYSCPQQYAALDCLISAAEVLYFFHHIAFAGPRNSAGHTRSWSHGTGVVTVEVLEARLPPRVHTISRKEKPLHPYAALVVGSAGTSVE